MSVYNNRKSCVPCQVKEEPKPEPKPEVKPEPQPEVLVYPSCKLFKVTSITKVRDKIYIMLDDCTFLTADVSVVDGSVCSDNLDTSELTNELAELKAKVLTLESKEDKDTVFDPSSLTTQIADLQTKVDNINAKADVSNEVEALKTKVETLEAQNNQGQAVDLAPLETKLVELSKELKTLKDGLVDIQDLSGTTTHKAYNA